MRRLVYSMMLTGLMIFIGTSRAEDSSSDVITATLNHLEISFDRQTGSIVQMKYPGVGTLLDVPAQRASIVDLAYPIEGFEPFRLASRFSKHAQFDITDRKVIIHWEKLGPSRESMEQPGNVSVTVTLEALPDGESIVMTCDIDNKSDIAVRQVIFPDFSGLLPFAGEKTTLFKTCGFHRAPFPELRMNEKRFSGFFGEDNNYGAEEFMPGGSTTFGDNWMWTRWMDFGGLVGGLSIYPKQWGWDPVIPIRLHHFEDQEKIRMLYVNDITIPQGGKWKSCEFVMTPHQNGWAKGIEPYGQWVSQHLDRKYPLPKHVRDGLGFRTVFMALGYPKDPENARWKFSDLPALAKEAREHGLDEVAMWAWLKGFTLPLPPPHSGLGTMQDLVQAIKECKQIGVNVTPFISVIQAGADTAAKYGLKISQTGGWTQHTDTIPRFNPKYATLSRCVQAGPDNKLWQKEVLESTGHLVNIGIPSLGWDQFWGRPGEQMYHVATKIRQKAKKADPQSVFASEMIFNPERDSEYLDYTWNWNPYIDCQAFTSVFPGPRINCNVSASPKTVKLGFLDNLYLGVMPRKAGDTNGSDWIVNHKALSRSLKTCAKLRKQFLPYFTKGRFIGNCILKTDCPNTHISAYILPNSALMLVLNTSDDKTRIPFECDLADWLGSETGKYKVHIYNSKGKRIGKKGINKPVWKSKTSELKSLDIEIYEFRTK